MHRTAAGKVLIMISLGGILLSACSQQESKGPAVRPPVPVVVATATSQTVPVQLQAVGNVEARATVAVKSRVGGELARVHFREGQEVKAGDVLFTIDTRPFRAILEQTEAVLAKDLAQQENAREEARRYEDLIKQGFVSRQEYDRVRTNFASLEGVVRADRATMENARLQLEYCTIRSPIAGRAGTLLVDQGNLVKANDDDPMVVINQLEPIDVAFSLPEQHLPQIKQSLAAGSLPLTAASPSAAGPPEQGAVTFLDNAVDSSTGTILLKGSFANADRQLWPGEFVHVVLTLTQIPQATVVPTQAVQSGQQGTYVFIVNGGGSVEVRPVTAGIVYGDRTVITRGVTPGETVVTEGQQRLYPDAKVAVKEAAMPSAAADGPRS